MESSYPLVLLVHNLFFFTRILKLINSLDLATPGKQQKDFFFLRPKRQEQSVSGFRSQSKVLERSFGSRKPDLLLFFRSTKIGRGSRDPGENADLATLSPVAPCYLVMKDKSAWPLLFPPTTLGSPVRLPGSGPWQVLRHCRQPVCGPHVPETHQGQR